MDIMPIHSLCFNVDKGTCVHEREMHDLVQIILVLVVNDQFPKWYAKIMEENACSPSK